MENSVIFSDAPIYTNQKGEALSLPEIILNKKIISVTIAYLSKERKVKAPGIKGLIGIKIVMQDEKEITINDPKGIIFFITEGVEAATIRFWNEKEFRKLDDGNYDDRTLWKRFVYAIIHPYQINFHLGNLNKVDWQ